MRNTDWATWTSVLGFPVMGIWPEDGARPLSADRCPDGSLVAVSDDRHTVRLYRCPGARRRPLAPPLSRLLPRPLRPCRASPALLPRPQYPTPSSSGGGVRPQRLAASARLVRGLRPLRPPRPPAAVRRRSRRLRAAGGAGPSPCAPVPLAASSAPCQAALSAALCLSVRPQWSVSRTLPPPPPPPPPREMWLPLDQGGKFWGWRLPTAAEAAQAAEGGAAPVPAAEGAAPIVATPAVAMQGIAARPTQVGSS